MHYFRYNTNRFNVSIEFYDKVNIIFGFSGSGKSLLMDRMESSYKTGRDAVSDLNIVLLNSKASVANYSDSNVLIFVDEEMLKFFFDKIEDSLCYWMIISRKTYSNLKLSYRSFWVAKYDEQMDKMSIVPRIELDIDCDIKPVTKYLLLCEDSGYGLDFMKCIYDNVGTTNGKSNVIKAVKEHPNDNIILIVDGGGIGYSLKKISDTLRRRSRTGIKSILFMPECFEHILLCSETLNFDEDISRYYTTEYQNTEEFCEEKLLDVTKGTKIECNHNSGKMSDCWIKDCSGDCTKDCSYFIKGDKIISVLKNGPLSNLIPLYKGNTSLKKLTERYDKCQH